VTLDDALRIAKEQNLDLVEVAPTAKPPVCRLLNYGKFKYEQAKKERQASKSQKSTGLREVRMRPKIGQHDIDFKLKAVKRLLSQGAKVKLTVRFRGREIVHPGIGRELLQDTIEQLGEAAKVERPIMMEGRSMTVILIPGKLPKVDKAAKTEKDENVEQAEKEGKEEEDAQAENK